MVAHGSKTAVCMFLVFQGSQEVYGARRVQDGLRRSTWQDARSERASAASDASGALRRAYSAQGSSRYFKACIQCARQVMNFISIL